MPSKTITIVGVTGTQGSSVAAHFLKEPDWHVRGLTRDTTSPKATALAAKGIEIVIADLDDVASLTTAFAGSHAIFTVTDYASNARRVSTDEKLQRQAREAGKSFAAFAGDLERQQGINAALAASSPDVLPTLERYVFSTLPAVSQISKGKCTYAYEFDAKAAAEAYIHANLPQLAEKMSTVTMGNYLENWGYIPALAPQKETDGSYSFLWLDCSGEHTAHPELWAIRDAGAFVKSLVINHPPGINALAATAEITSVDYAATWGRVMGRKAQSKVVSEAEYAAMVPEEIREAFVELVNFVTEFGVGELKRGEELGVAIEGIEAFVRAQDWIL